jgi:acyl-coenzyme A thioesterase PaaI-like protein
MADTLSRGDANRCFVCGPANPRGLGLRFTLADGVCRSEFTPGEFHGGFETVTHGGIVFSVLDDAMANWLFLQGARGLTAKCEVRYREPLPIGTRVGVEARLQSSRRRLYVLSSALRLPDSGRVVAEAEARFMVEEFGRLAATANG